MFKVLDFYLFYAEILIKYLHTDLGQNFSKTYQNISIDNENIIML
jgi:hypothetical protein